MWADFSSILSSTTSRGSTKSLKKCLARWQRTFRHISCSLSSWRGWHFFLYHKFSLLNMILPNLLIYWRLLKWPCRKYAAVVYITHNRFETGKKKLNYLTLDNFIFCVDQMINNWSCRNPSNLQLNTTSLAVHAWVIVYIIIISRTHINRPWLKF